MLKTSAFIALVFDNTFIVVNVGFYVFQNLIRKLFWNVFPVEHNQHFVFLKEHVVSQSVVNGGEILPLKDAFFAAAVKFTENAGVHQGKAARCAFQFVPVL